jgi:hypothetical protein
MTEDEVRGRLLLQQGTSGALLQQNPIQPWCRRFCDATASAHR